MKFNFSIMLYVFFGTIFLGLGCILITIGNYLSLLCFIIVTIIIRDISKLIKEDKTE